MALVANQRLDRTDKRVVKFVRETEIEQPPPAAAKEHVNIEPAPERGDLLQQGLAVQRNCLPLEPLARQRKDVKLPMPVTRQPKDQGFVLAEKPLRLLGAEGTWARKDSVIRILLFEPRSNGSELLLGVAELTAQNSNRGAVLLRLWPGESRDHRLIAPAPER